jgi:hypothetical protein
VQGSSSPLSQVILAPSHEIGDERINLPLQANMQGGHQSPPASKHARWALISPCKQTCKVHINLPLQTNMQSGHQSPPASKHARCASISPCKQTCKVGIHLPLQANMQGGQQAPRIFAASFPPDQPGCLQLAGQSTSMASETKGWVHTSAKSTIAIHSPFTYEICRVYLNN